MQYILSEEEYKDLVPKKEYNELMDKVEELNAKVLELACGGKCMKDHGGYCDSCPLAGLSGTGTCFKVREYSK